MSTKQHIESLIELSNDYRSIKSELDLKAFIERDGQYLYFIVWSYPKEIYSWGTMSGKSNRIRKSSILNPKLTGKYDRRVDYLMLLSICGFEDVYLFETNEHPRVVEQSLKDINGTKYCYHGLEGHNRDDISRNLYMQFKYSAQYADASQDKRDRFDEYMEEVFFQKMRHPKNPKRAFFYGDSLEPGFLNTIGKAYLEESIEEILKVKF